MDNIKKLLKEEYRENLDWLPDLYGNVFWVRIDLLHKPKLKRLGLSMLQVLRGGKRK